MTEPDVRWLQRLENDSKALPALARGVAVARERQLSELEEQGLIQAFEFTHELSWLLLRDDLVDQAPVASAIPGMQSEKLWCAASRAGVRPCPGGAAGGSHTTAATKMKAASSPPGIPGLSEQHSQAILELLIQQSEVEAVVLYGSRAMGRQHPGSDIDLCLQAPEMTLSQLLSLGADLDELLLPCRSTCNCGIASTTHRCWSTSTGWE